MWNPTSAQTTLRLLWQRWVLPSWPDSANTAQTHSSPLGWTSWDLEEGRNEHYKVLCLSHRKRTICIWLTPINPTINGPYTGLSALHIFSLIPVRQGSIHHRCGLSVLRGTRQNLVTSESRSASIFCSYCPALLCINSFGKHHCKKKGKPKVSYSVWWRSQLGNHLPCYSCKQDARHKYFTQMKVNTDPSTKPAAPDKQKKLTWRCETKNGLQQHE